MTEESKAADLDEAFDKTEDELKDSAVQPEQEAEAVEQVEEETVETPEYLQPVSAWKEEARQAWESLAGNAEHHDILKQLNGQFTSDYQYRTQLEQERAQLSEQAQTAQQFNQLAQQYGDVLRGQNPLDVASQLFYYSQQLQQNPQGTIQALAEQYGVDLNQLVQDQPYVDESTQQLYGQFAQMQQQIHSQQQAMEQQRQERIYTEANNFQYEKDAEGNLLRPHVPEVMQDMIQLIKSGAAQSYQEAYDKACRLSDTVWQTMQKAQGQKQSQQRQQQAQKAIAAKQAQPKRGKSSVTAPAGVEDVDDAINKALAEQEA